VRRPRLTALVVALVATAVWPASAAAGGLTTGFNPDPVLTGPSAWANPFWIDRARADGARLVRVNVFWSEVAPVQRPAGFVPADPSSPGYNWSLVDAEVEALAHRGMRVLMNLSSAPIWAEGPDRPGSVRAGTWKPSPAQFARFAHAAARRYDGSFRAPGLAGALPRVRDWQAWNEPNLDTYLTPQWTRSGTPASPGVYRGLLNSFYAAVKRVSPGNLVVSAGMAPYGNPPGVNFPGGYRVAPLVFDRALFSAPVSLDALAQNIYPIHGPLWHAYQPDDVGAADLYKVATVLHRAVAADTAVPHRPKQVWVTELGWSTNPPNPGGVPVVEQARWYEQALYTLWRQGVDTVLLLQLVDAPPVPSYAASYQTGLYYADGTPKPAATAFRFPFIAVRRGPDTVDVWGRAPAGGRLQIERAGGRRVLGSVPVNADQLFMRTIHVRGRVALQGQLGGLTSLTWTP
jgi:hypothetical protein